MRIAVIDCGTNTFKLLIAKVVQDRWFPIYESTLGVKLAKGSTSQGIAEDRMARGIDVLQTFKENIINFEADEIHAFATSAIRSAPNGQLYTTLIKKNTGIDIQIIDGKKEAELIFHGIKQSIDLTEIPVLIMDIGGGSTEFIIANNTGILWKESYQLGSSRLNNLFQPTAPLTQNDIISLHNHFELTLPSLFDAIQQFKPQVLLGNSGSFNSLVKMINLNYKEVILNEKNNEIPLHIFHELNQQLLDKTHEEKLNILGLDPMRADIIALATLLVDFVLNKSGIQKLQQTPFALKEGVVGQLMER